MCISSTISRALLTTAAVSLLVVHPSSATISVISELTNGTLATINDLPARFIPERFSYYGIQGYIAYANPPTACTKVVPPPNFPGTEYPINWILLAKRSSDCHFQTKIENAQNAGYTAVIIHNVGSNASEIMGVEDPSKIIIYATFIGEYDGKVLRNYTYPSQAYIRIQDDFSINGYLLPFSIVVGLCFLVMIVFMARLLWQQVVRWIRERRRSRRRKLPASALKKLPTQKWTKGDHWETCAVCLDDFVEQDKIRVLPCSHGFHQKCIDPWLTKGRRVCPICKRKVIVADERFRDSDSDTEDETAPLLGTSSSVPQNAASGEETFVHGETSEQPSGSQAAVASSSSASHSHHQILPQVHSSRGRYFFPKISNILQRSSRTNQRNAESLDSSPGACPGHRNQVLAEVHHSSEVLRARLSDSLPSSSRDNAIFVSEDPEVIDDVNCSSSSVPTSTWYNDLSSQSNQSNEDNNAESNNPVA